MTIREKITHVLKNVCNLCGFGRKDHDLTERVLLARKNALSDTVASAHRLKRASEEALSELAKHTARGNW